MHKKIIDGDQECIYEGRISGVFQGFRNLDTTFKLQGGSTWRQMEYWFEYHYLYSPKAEIIKVTNKEDHKETFYIKIEGVKSMVEVRSSYS